MINPLLVPKEPFSCLIFDCDGTLADTMPNHFAAWNRALSERQASLLRSDFYAMGGMPTEDIIRKLNAQFNYSLDVHETHLAKEQYYGELLGSVREITPVADIARYYYEKKPMAVASGGIRRIVEATLGAVGLTHLFDAVVTADDVRNGKPSPDIFLLAADLLKINPAECVVYEDGDPGVEAAKAAGMQCIDVRFITGAP